MRYLAAFLIIMVLLLPTVAPYDPMTTSSQTVQPPNHQHLLGTDQLGRDVLSRTLYGGRLTILLSIGALMTAVIPGITIGVSGAFLGMDRIVIIAINTLLALPGLILALVILTVLGQGIGSIMLAVGFIQIAPFAQVTRAATLGVRNAEYIEGAIALGGTRLYILWKHILPNIMPTLLAYVSVTFGYCLLNIGALGFLGLNGLPGIPEWGAMLAEGREVFREAPWVSAAPGLMIFLLVMTVNWLADALIRRG